MSEKFSNILLLGDSHLSRNSGDAGESLILLFKKSFPDTIIQNLAKGGADTRYGKSILSQHHIILPTLALVLFGTNDAASWKQVPLQEFSENYADIISKLKSDNVSSIILITPPPVNQKKQTPPGRSDTDIHQYAQEVINLANKYQLDCLDLYSLLKSVMIKEDIHYRDGVHLNERGYIIFFNALCDLITKKP